MEKEPTGHFTHVDDELAPMVAEYMPGSQAAHDADPDLSAKVPALHSTHEENWLAPISVVNLPGGHEKHDIDPSWSAYVPGAQGWHAVTPSNENVPRLHCWQEDAPETAE